MGRSIYVEEAGTPELQLTYRRSGYARPAYRPSPGSLITRGICSDRRIRYSFISSCSYICDKFKRNQQVAGGVEKLCTACPQLTNTLPTVVGLDAHSGSNTQVRQRRPGYADRRTRYPYRRARCAPRRRGYTKRCMRYEKTKGWVQSGSLGARLQAGYSPFHYATNLFP